MCISVCVYLSVYMDEYRGDIEEYNMRTSLYI